MMHKEQIEDKTVDKIVLLLLKLDDLDNKCSVKYVLTEAQDLFIKLKMGWSGRPAVNQRMKKIKSKWRNGKTR